MGKILVSLKVPMLGEKYDVFVQDDMNIGTLTNVLVQGIYDISGGKYNISGREMLMSLKPDELLNPQNTLYEYGISDGTPLMII